ncbi:precorrin-6y C5,15-methyltransferase (decarboxylating) subunit CbiE [Desulfofustis limnaeus]|jgi:precorrin-6Y C5,15-methyltransferase (decarboxylating)|uniref:Precorrin-6Y-methylase n=1 Tax=Desulfofustis limnaeus TaxID=2740163 RepID=A0ABM7W869_9BACT|nr:precorrin-6y C5,15-methyltransferase (decarboxylating) subunit CbiE [Desulfofustis limnaeus]MDX9896945.1 precorrin-6y C5,15-methyltransferase (decarboxylating) subunit CbiE [Desulfofustis sp.]BDD87184.1 precorrin-6Y-methylase [Desulfofustis limnaeus]
MHTIYVAGLVGDHLPEHIRALASSGGASLVASPTIHARVSEQLPEFASFPWIPITPLEPCLETVARQVGDGPVIILVTGDPLFYGVGRIVQKRFADRPVVFLPTVSTMQLCFARFGIAWDNAGFLSLHGRPLELLAERLQEQTLFVFTDARHNATVIARFLLGRIGETAVSSYLMHVAENLATTHERLFSGTLAAAAQQSFGQPHCLIVQKVHQPSSVPPYRFGLKEEDLVHSRGLITKNEIRAAVLHALALPERGVLWDIGAGSGSIGIEAARLFPALTVYAVERNPAEIANITNNRERFQCWNLVPVQGTAPSALAGLPRPDRVFVGGSGGNLEILLRYLSETIAAGAIMVVTAVRPETRQVAPALLAGQGCRVSISRVAVSRFDYPALAETRLNPIDIIQAEKRDG